MKKLLLAIVLGLWLFVPAEGQITAGTVNAKQSGTWNITNISGTVSLPTGAATETTLAKLTALTTITTGQQAVTATATVLPTVTAERVCIKVLTGGTQTVYFGPSGVTTTTGQELSPGDAWCGKVSNLNKIFVIAGSTGSTVAYDVLN